MPIAGSTRFFPKKFSQNEDKWQSMPARIWRPFRVLRERHKMSKIAVLTAENVGALLQIAPAKRAIPFPKKFSQNAGSGQMMSARFACLPCSSWNFHFKPAI